MSTYARSVPEVQRTYKDVPAVLFAALQQRNKQVADLRQQQKDAQDEFQQTRQQLLQERDEAKRIQAETEAELRKTRDEFAQYSRSAESRKGTTSRRYSASAGRTGGICRRRRRNRFRSWSEN